MNLTTGLKCDREEERFSAITQAPEWVWRTKI